VVDNAGSIIYNRSPVTRLAAALQQKIVLKIVRHGQVSLYLVCFARHHKEKEEPVTVLKLIGRILRLRDILKIKRFEFKAWGRELHLWVKPYRNGCLCPECERRAPIVRIMPQERVWRDIRVCGMNVYLHYTPKEIRCPTHGRRQEIIPWAAIDAQVTYRFEVLALHYCHSMTQLQASQLLGISKSTLSDILHRTIERLRKGHRIRALRTIGVDEVAYHKGKRYATVVYDLDRGCVVWIGMGKGRETIDVFFQNHLSDFQRRNIRFASCDMGETYIGAIEHWCPNATLVLDRFHIVKALNETLDTIRMEEWRKLKGSAKAKAVKGLRWLLYRHPTSRTKAQTRTLNALKKSNRRIWRAWVLKDEFQRLWDYTYKGSAQSFIHAWMAAARRSRLQPIMDFVKTISKHLPAILAFIPSKLTNAAAEGINRIIGIVRNRASGFKSFDSFADLIYLTIGDLDLPDQIPAAFDTR
jgi:transposase